MNDAFLKMLTLSPLGEGRFRSEENEPNPYGRVYGGQPEAQSLAAALHTVPKDRTATSLQICFMSGARTDAPIDYTVRTLQEGKRVSSREVSAEQSGRGLMRALVAAQTPAAPRRARRLPAEAAAGPENGIRPSDLSEALRKRAEPSSFFDMDPHPNIEYRFVDPERALMQDANAPSLVHYWMRIKHELPPYEEAPHLHAVAMTYMSDWWLPLVAIAPHLGDEPDGMYLATLNHTVWFHEPVRADQWFLVESESPWANYARGLSQARLFTRDGTLAASTAQDCLQTSRAPLDFKLAR